MLMMREKDKRAKLMNEILNGIKVLKLYAWENSFRDQVQGFREKETKSLKTMAYLNASMVFTFSAAPIFVRLSFIYNRPGHTFLVEEPNWKNYLSLESNFCLNFQDSFYLLLLFDK